MTRDEILGASCESPWAEIDIEEWGGSFLLRPLSGAHAEEVALLNVQAKETGQMLCLRGLAGRVTAWTVSDSERNLLFKPGDAAALTEKHLAVCARVYAAVLKANQLAEGAVAVEEAGKNSGSIQS